MAGIYIHIPFCKQACTYCNFHFSTSLKLKGAFLEALKKEISLENNFIPSEEIIETIYFGGGTPSILSAEETGEIIEQLFRRFNIDKNVEITIEANPDDISKEKLAEWKNLGINRLSVGIQSFNDEELKWMNRAHSSAQALSSLILINEAGFDNFTADLIYGSPFQSNADLEENINILLRNNVPHISAYALTAEEKTALAHQIKSGIITNIDTDKQAVHFEILMQMLLQAGFQHYEISNFAKPGKRSKHNSSYWNGKAYYGFGAGAHCFNGNNIRRWNIANNALYIQSIEKGIVPYEEETLTAVQQMNEMIMISLRTIEGLQADIFTEKFGDKALQALLKKASKYFKEELLVQEENFIRLTKKGKFLADGIAAGLFF